MRDPLARRSALFGWIASIALHAGVVLLASVALVPPDSGFEFQAPLELELGLVEATEVEVVPPASAPPEASAEPAGPTSTTGEGPAAVDAGVVADAGERRRRDAGVDAAGAEPGPGSEGPPVAFLPPGAQLALRVDMDRVRGSPVGEDIASLLRVVPDWRALLGESGVDPVRDLSRVLIATPNLQRSSIVVAGRLAASAPEPRALAERFAEVQGVPIEWREQAGVPATRWPSPDGIERDVALIGERHFVIARPEDLPRVLAIAAARRRGGRAPASGPAEALLAMGAGEGLSIEIDNAGAFLRRSPCAVPLTLRAGVSERGDGAQLRAEARFATSADAADAGACLGRLARQYASNVIVSLYGLAGPLDRLDFRADGEVLHIETQMRYSEIRTIAGLIRGLFDRPASPGAAPTPPVAVPPPPPAPPPPPPAEPPPNPF